VARRIGNRTLGVWANGQLMGNWHIPRQGPEEFTYSEQWRNSPDVRPISLSLPIDMDGTPLKGDKVGFYFDNLLPESGPIRRRLQARFNTASSNAFDLLEAIGRDCVGAIQLLREGEMPDDVFRIQAEPVTKEAIAEHLLAVLSTPISGQSGNNDDFRISIAGAQEKTAFTWHHGRWCKPRRSTPTTHIFKLPLGLVGDRQVDMSTSIENEWFCAQILRGYGLPVAACDIGQFGSQKALIVERFDRRLHSSGKYWLRLPQEDFCQATGIPASAKYESEGGPGLVKIAQVLQGSERRDEDLATLLRAQLLFWMLAATDGHAKNFSVHLLAGGRYHLTPLYDIISLWPAVGRGRNQFDRKRLRLAMAFRGKNAHYRIDEIRLPHILQTAKRCGLGEAAMKDIVAGVVERTPIVIRSVESKCPKQFPARVIDSITRGLGESARRLETMLA
jgi:serine/threonine-protein kinase HipA